MAFRRRGLNRDACLANLITNLGGIPCKKQTGSHKLIAQVFGMPSPLYNANPRERDSDGK